MDKLKKTLKEAGIEAQIFERDGFWLIQTSQGLFAVADTPVKTAVRVITSTEFMQKIAVLREGEAACP